MEQPSSMAPWAHTPSGAGWDNEALEASVDAGQHEIQQPTAANNSNLPQGCESVWSDYGFLLTMPRIHFRIPEVCEMSLVSPLSADTGAART